MLLGGDELGRTQRRQQQRVVPGQRALLVRLGARRGQQRLLDFTQRLIALRREHPVFRRRGSSRAAERLGSGVPDVWWFRPDGRRMTQADWRRGDAHTLGVFLNGARDPAP